MRTSGIALVYPKGTWAYVGLSICLVGAFCVTMFQQGGPVPTAIVGSAMMGGLVAWLLTTAKRPADPLRILPIYVATAAMLMAHIMEEYVWGFGPRIGGLTGRPWSQGEFYVLFGLVVPIFWIGAGALVYFRNPFGNWILWFVFIGMIFGEPAHLMFAVVEGGRYHYFPGFWSALLPMVLGYWGMHRLITDYRRGPGMAR